MKIRDLANWNPWWEGIERGSNYLIKYLRPSFIAKWKPLEEDTNYLIRGPRQVGKTWFLYRTIARLIENYPLENVTYISCDRLGGLNELRNTVRELMRHIKRKEVFSGKKDKKFLLLDEITSIQDWDKAFKEFCELEFFRVYATDSRPKELEKKAEYFPGRCQIRNFFPLSFKEFCISLLDSLQHPKAELGDVSVQKDMRNLREVLKGFGITRNSEEIMRNLRKIKIGPNLENLKQCGTLYRYAEILQSLFEVYLETGGYPAAIQAKIDKKEMPYAQVVEYTLESIEKEGLKGETLNLILPELIRRLGSKFSYLTIAREIGINEVTLAQYIHTLERSFILRELYYFDNRVHPAKRKKVYFTDPFILKALQNYYGLKDVDESLIVEGAVINSFARKIEDPFLRLWKTRMGYGSLGRREVNLMVKGKKLLRVEIKYGKVPSLKGLDLILTEQELEMSKKPFKVPVSLFLACF